MKVGLSSILTLMLALSYGGIHAQCTTGCVSTTDAGALNATASPTQCAAATTPIGGHEYRNITLPANTFYDFSWANGGNTSGLCAVKQSGGTGSSADFTTVTTNNWFVGTTNAVLRFTGNRSNCTYSPTPTSAVLTYRRSTPATPTGTPSGGGTVCVGASVTLTRNYTPSANWTYHWVNGTASTTSLGTGNTYNPPTTSPGATTYYIRGNNNGCWGAAGNGVTVTVVADPVPPSLVKSPIDATVCVGASLTVTPSGGSGGTGTCTNEYRYSVNDGGSWSAWNATVPSITGTVGVTRIESRRVCSGSGCTTSTNSVSWTVVADPVAPVITKTPNVAQVCAGTSLTVTPTSGSGGTGSCTDQYRFSTDNGANWSAWSGSPPAPITGVVGVTIVQGRRTCTGVQCDTDMNQVSWVVNANPTPTFNSIGGPYCISQTTPISLVGSGIPTPPPGSGIFSGTGVSGNDFVPSLAAVGTNTLTYTYTDANGCTSSAQRTVVVTGLPLVNFSGLSPTGYCINNTTPVPLTGFPSGGSFSGPGISGSNFTPSAAGVGLHAITYTYTDANGCVNSETQQVNVFALPIVGIFNLAPQYCVTDPTVSISGFPPGGNFSGTGMTGNQFSPSGATVGGPYTITYSYTDANSCSNTATAQVTVNAVTNANAGAGGNSCNLSFQLGAVPSIGTGTWTLASGPGTVTFSPSVNAPNATATVSTYGIYSFNWTEVNGACSSSSQVTVNYYQQPVANAGSGGIECDFDFNLNALPTVGIGLWSQIGGPGTATFGNSSNSSTVVNVSQSGVYTFTWTETNGTCVSSDAVSVTFYDQPVSDAGPDADECDLDHVFSATGSFGPGVWTQFSGPGSSSFVPNNSPTATVSVDSYGQYVFQWAETNGICSDAATVTINFFEQPVAEAGFGGFECDFDFDLAATPSVGTGTWTQTAGSGTSTFSPNANDPNATVTVSQYGTYSFQWEEVNGTCSDNDFINVTFDQQTNADAGVGGDECDLTFTFNGTASFGTGIWTSAGPGTAFYTNDNSPTSEVTVSQYGTYTFTWTETSGSCITSDAVTVNFYEQPVANAGAGGTSCDFDFTFSAIASVGTGTWTQTGGPGSASFDNANSPTATATVDAYGTYTFQWQEVNGTCSDNASVTVIFYEQPVADAGAGGNECDLDFTLAASTSVGSGVWTLGSGPGSASFVDATDANTTVTVDQYGAYTLTWTETNGTCSDDVSIVVNFYEQPVADAGADGDACDLDHVLGAVLSTGTGVWTQTSGSGTASFSDATSPTATVTVDLYDTYVFTWTETNGTCSDAATVTVNFWTQPTANAGLGGDECDLDFALNAIPNLGSGEWTQTSGLGTSTFVSSTSANTTVSVDLYGTYTYTWTETNGTCVSSDVITVNYYEQPTANAGTGGSECDLDFTLNATSSVGVGTWTQTSGPGFSNFVPNAGTPGAAVTVSQYGQYTFTWMEVNGSCSDAQTITVDFFQQPVANAGAVSDQCDLDITLAAMLTSGIGTWTYTGPGTGVFTPNENAPNATLTVDTYGTYDLTWTEVNGTCSDASTVTVTFNPLPVVSYTGLAATYCVDQTAPVQLTGTPAGGTYSGPGISSSLFIPSIANVGTHAITYSYTDANGCTDSETQSVDVMPIPVVSFTGLAAEYCVSDATQNGLVGSPVGGTFSGPGIVGNDFIAANAGAGTHVVTYSYTDGFGCVGTTTQSVVVNPLPVVAFTGLAASYCVDAVQVVLSPTPAGGQFTGAGITGVTFNPATAGVGVHDIEYVFTDGNGCSNSTVQTVTVNALPQPVIVPSGQQEICAGSSLMLDAGAGFGQYVWSNGQSGQTISVSTAGDYTVTVTSLQGCSTTSAPVEIIVNTLPIVDLGNDTILCPGNFYTLDAGNPGLSYLWVTQEITQQITVGTTGNYTVEVTDANGCVGTDAVLVSFSNLLQPVITAGGPTTFCQGGSVMLSGPSGLSYEWSTGAITQNVVITQSGPVELTVQDQFGCTGVSNTIDVNVNQLPNAVVVASGPTNLCQGASVTLTASNNFGSYLWNPTNSTNQSVTVSQAGNYSVTVTDPVNGCSATSQVVTVTQSQGVQPTIVANGPLEFCVGGSVVLSVEPQGAFTSYLWTTGSTTATVNVNTTSQVGVSVLDANNCLNETLLASPTAITVWNPVPLVEQSGGTLAVINGPFECYQWFRNGNPVPGAVSAIFTPEFSGNHHVQVCDVNGCYANSTNIEFTVGVADVQDAFHLNIYPNPTGGQFVVEADLGSNMDVTLIVRDVLGRELMNPERIEGASTFRRTFDISHLSNGIYYVQVLGDNGMTVRPVVKR